MPVLTPFVTPAKLKDAISEGTYLQIFDDRNSGDVAEVDASGQVQIVLRRAHARVVARLPAIYSKLPDGADPEIPGLLEDAELLYATGLAYQRHPEYARELGKGAIKDADGMMELVQQAILRIADAPPEPEPANVGGLVVDSGRRVFLDNPDGSSNSGDF